MVIVETMQDAEQWPARVMKKEKKKHTHRQSNALVSDKKYMSYHRAYNMHCKRDRSLATHGWQYKLILQHASPH